MNVSKLFIIISIRPTYSEKRVTNQPSTDNVVLPLSENELQYLANKPERITYSDSYPFTSANEIKSVDETSNISTIYSKKVSQISPPKFIKVSNLLVCKMLQEALWPI